MAIDLTGLSSTSTASNRTRLDGNTGTGQAAKGDKSADTPRTQSETVKLSNEALSMQKLEERAASLPDVDTDRVAKIKQAIEDGSFNIDAERVAAKMMNLEQKLFG